MVLTMAGCSQFARVFAFYTRRTDAFCPSLLAGKYLDIVCSIFVSMVAPLNFFVDSYVSWSNGIIATTARSKSV